MAKSVGIFTFAETATVALVRSFLFDDSVPGGMNPAGIGADDLFPVSSRRGFTGEI
jgi:hypothetical protein